MIAARVKNLSGTNEELLEHAARVAPGQQKVRLEVEYVDPATGDFPDWEISGDAVEVDVVEGTIVTLPPYSEVAP